MRAAVGDIVAAPGGTAFIAALHAECTAVAAASGFEPRAVVAERARAQLTAAGSTFTASMLRDIEGKGRIEADHVIGDLIARGRRLAPEAAFPMLAEGLYRSQGLRSPAGAGGGLSRAPRLAVSSGRAAAGAGCRIRAASWHRPAGAAAG